MHPLPRDGQERQPVNQSAIQSSRTLRRLRLLLLLLLLCALPTTLAAAGAALEIPWFVVAGGGGSSQSAAFTLMGSVGQPVNGHSSSVDFTLNHGFWQTTGNQGPTGSGSTIYLPQVRR
jgi:hypothetical protein